MATTTETVSILAVLKDKFSGPIRKMGLGFRKLLAIIKKVGRAMSKAFSGALGLVTRFAKKIFSIRGLLFGAFGGIAILKTFITFKKGLTQVSTLIDVSKEKMAELGEGVLRVSKLTGDSFASLNKGLFDLISSGVDTGKSLIVLEQAAKLAAAGGTETSVAVDGLTSVLNAYNRSADDAADITDTFFQAMKGGKITVAELASSIGTVVSVASKLGINFEEVSSAISAMTLSGIRSRVAATALNGFFTAIINPAEDALELVAKMRAEIDGPRGLVGAIEILEKAAVELGDTGIAKLFPNIRALKSVFALTANEGKKFKDILASMADKVGEVNKNFEKVRNTLGFQFKTLLRTIQVLFVRIGEAASPFIRELLVELEGFVDRLAAKKSQIESIVRTVAGTLKRAFLFLKTLFNQGEIITFIIKLGGEIVASLIKLQVVLIPTIIKIATSVGRVFGLALIKAIFGATKLGIIEQAAAGGFLGSTLLASLKLTLSEKEFKEIKDAANKLAKLRSELRGDIFLEEGRAAGKPAFLRSRKITRIPALKEAIKAFRRQITNKKSGIFGEETTNELSKSILDSVDKIDKQVQILLGESVGNIKDAITGKSGAALDELFEFLRLSSERLADAKTKDLVLFLIQKAKQGLALASKGLDKALDFIFPKKKGAGEKPTSGDKPQGELGRDEFFRGFSEGLNKITQEFSDFGQLGIEVAQTVAGAFSQAFVTMFQKGKLAIKEFASTFFALVARMILQALLFRAIAGFLFPGGGGGGDDKVQIPGTVRRRGGAIKRVFGGPVMGPKGRDVIPANLTRGEFVIRPESVAKYGMNFMSALNAGMFPKSLLSDLPRASTGIINSGRFASGGAVGGNSRGSETFVPTLVADEQTLDRLINGPGKAVLLRFMEEHRGDINRRES